MSMAVQDGRLYEEVVIAGFGGQGIILVGKLLAQAAMRTGIEVTFMPSYGAEVRGGTANCMIVVSKKPIPCPVVGRPHSLIAMNHASVNKFGPRIRPGGLLLFNSSLTEGEPQAADGIEVIGVPADEIAADLGSPKSANMVVLGAYLQKRGHISPDDAAKALPDVLAARYHDTLATNAKALQRGAEFVLCRV
jgi:2-oxoglutarate ferredoxin oxidoreductase subunit gamma